MIASDTVAPGERILLYGGAKVGKSSLLHAAPGLYVIDTDEAIARMQPIPGVSKPAFCIPSDWSSFLAAVDSVPIGVQTLAIDSMTPVVEWAKDDVCKHHVNKKGARVKSIEDFEYGSGWGWVYDLLCRLLASLDTKVRAGMNVVVVCHTYQERVNTPNADEASFVRDVPALPQVGKTCCFRDRAYSWADHCVFLARRYTVDREGRTTLMRRQVMFGEERGDFMAGSRSITSPPIDHILGKGSVFWTKFKATKETK